VPTGDSLASGQATIRAIITGGTKFSKMSSRFVEPNVCALAEQETAAESNE
jgi:hypothetical protein